MRGCFYLESALVSYIEVFPAHAGVFLTLATYKFETIQSSPRMRGCF